MRAQSSVEFLVILSVTLLGLLIFMGISQSESVGVSKTKIKTEAQNAVEEIGFAAQDVYSQGAGAKKKITVIIPYTYEAAMSGIGNYSIRLKADSDDYVHITEFEIYGSMPGSAGRHEIWIESEGSRVKVGNAMIFLGRESINTALNINSTKAESFTVKNVWDEPITVTISPNWPHTEVGLSTDNTFGLAVDESRTVMITFSSGVDALGFYPGSLNISGSDGSDNESIILPITVEVSSMLTIDGPPITVIPSSWSATGARGANLYESFQVCTNSETNLSLVQFSPSIGEPGDFVNMTDSLTNLDAGTCYPKTLEIGIPDDAAFGTYSGFVFLSGDVANAVDTIAISVTVGGMTNDTQGPEISSITVFPSGRAKYVNRPVAVRAVANDSEGNPIESCRLRIDGGAWYQMISKDGAFDEPVETAGYTFFSGFSHGNHTASVQCTDALSNSGPVVNQSFNILKEFLFITEDPGPTTDEQAWMDWIGVGFSSEGYAWNYDYNDSATFISGAPNTSFYSVIVAERFVSGMETRLNSHVSAGGSIVMIGQALVESPSALGVSVLGANVPANESAIDVVDDLHYITSGYSGSTTVVNQTIEFGRFWKDLSGSLLIKSSVGAPPQYHILGIAGGRYFWGPTTPDYLNPVGINITSRTLDHAINASSLQ
jgi:hypothetical protein